MRFNFNSDNALIKEWERKFRETVPENDMDLSDKLPDVLKRLKKLQACIQDVCMSPDMVQFLYQEVDTGQPFHNHSEQYLSDGDIHKFLQAGSNMHLTLFNICRFLKMRLYLDTVPAVSESTKETVSHKTSGNMAV